MLRLLRFLRAGDWHLHRREIIDRRPSDGSRWVRYYCRCSVCGEIKKFD